MPGLKLSVLSLQDFVVGLQLDLILLDPVKSETSVWEFDDYSSASYFRQELHGQHRMQMYYDHLEFEQDSICFTMAWEGGGGVYGMTVTNHWKLKYIVFVVPLKLDLLKT